MSKEIKNTTNKDAGTKDMFSWRYRTFDANSLTAADVAFLEKHKPTAAQLGRFADKVLTKEGTIRKA